MKNSHTFPNFHGQKLGEFYFLCRKGASIFVLMLVLLMGHVYGQEAKVSIDKKNVKLRVVLDEIERQTSYLFMYNNQVNTNSLVSVRVVNTPVQQVLQVLLKGKNIDFKQEGKHILLTVGKANAPRKSTVVEPDGKRDIRGQVTDVQGFPILGATIYEGNNVRGYTDAEGRYTVRVDPGALLNINSVGYESSLLATGDQTEYKVTLMSAFQSVDEVVVTGYQDMQKRFMVGSYQTVKMADILMPNYNAIDKMLQGIIPGVIVTNSSSRVGSSPSIQIRGTSTLLGNTSPLWVVDGIIQEDPLEINASTFMSTNLKEIIGNQVSWLNPMDIESVTVLKDASATAIYGSKASNGVIVVTTKKVNHNDRVRVNYNGSTTVGSQPNYGRFNVMNSQERLRFVDEVFDSGVPYAAVPNADQYTYEGLKRLYIEGLITQDSFTAKRAFLETVNTDWFNLLTRVGVDQNHSLSITGGSEKMTVASSLSYSDQQGQEIGNSGKRYTGRVSSTLQLHPKVKIGLSLMGGYNGVSSFGNQVNPMQYALSTSRSIPAYTQEGDLAYYQKTSYYPYNKLQQTLGYNILNEKAHSGAFLENIRLLINGDLRWTIKPWLVYNFTGGYNHAVSSSSTTMGEQTYYVANAYRGYDVGTAMPGSAYMQAAVLPFGGEFFTNDLRQKTYTLQNKFNMMWDLQAHSRINILVGQELRSGTNVGHANTVYGYSKERGEAILRPTLPSVLVPTTGATSTYEGYGILDNLYNGRWARTNQTNNFISLFATAAYAYKDRYVFNGSIRNDISNRFGQDVNKRFDPTYSLGFSYRVAEEEFVKDLLPQLSQFNLRATYGLQGNALTNQSPELILIRQGVKNVFSQYYSSIGRIPNPNLSWERTSNWNFGADIVLFNKISTTVDYYKRESNAILSQDVPFEYGVLSTNMNGGMVYNQGIEGMLSFSPINKKEVGFHVSLNASRNWNTTGKAFNKSTYAQYLNGRSGAVLKEGYPVSGFWSFSYAGLDPNNGNAMFHLFDTDADVAKEDPTSYMLYSGQTTPSITGGMQLSLRYKQWTLGAGFSAVMGNHTRLTSPYANFGGGFRLPNAEVNLDRRLIDRWKQPGDEQHTLMPSLNTKNTANTFLPDGVSSGSLLSFWEQSDVMVTDASFLRMRNIDVSYRLNPAYAKRLKLSGLAFTASLNNIFVVGSSKFQGLDPELKNSVMPKTFSFGIACGI